MKIHQQGFSPIYVVFIIVILAAIGVAGYKVMDNKEAAIAKTSSSVVEKPQKDVMPAVVPEKKSAHSDDEAVALVQKTYDTVTDYVQRTTNANQGQIDSVKDNLSNDLYTKLSTNYQEGRVYRDQFACAQARADSFSVAFAETVGNNAKVLVTEKFGSSTVVVTSTVDLTTLKITDIACPQ